MKKIVSIILAVAIISSLFPSAVLAGTTDAFKATAISAGYLHTVALRENGEVWAWGSNGDGQLGDGTEDYIHVPVKSKITGVKQISAGGFIQSHTVALKENGEVWTWGNNEYGQLGNGTDTSRSLPVKVNISGVKQISAGGRHTVALKENGEVWTWGQKWKRNENGHATTEACLTPVKVGITDVKQVSAGLNFTVLLKENGEVWAWGANGDGQLGDGTKTHRVTPVKVNISGVKQVSAGGHHTVALKENGEVWAWGNNDYGRLGDGTNIDRAAPVKVNISGVKQISAGGRQTIALTESGTVWAWGYNHEGQLGDGTEKTHYEPVIVGISGVKQVSSGQSHTIVLKENGEMWTWGLDQEGALGNGPGSGHSAIPVKVADIFEKEVTAKYRSDLLADNKDLTFFYSDYYFVENDGYTYNHDLAKASLALELSSWTKCRCDEKMRNIQELDKEPEFDECSADEKMENIKEVYKELGFDEDSIEQYNYEKHLSDNSDKVAYSFASKKIYDGTNLIAVVVRGGGYGAEWRSNFHVGDGTKHTGFNTAADEVYRNLVNYRSDKGLKGNRTKIWITGYSRGAAVANLVAGKINEKVPIHREDLYVYTFATPNGVVTAKHNANNAMHNNIYNFVLPYDIVPNVAPEKWGYGKYGKTLMVKNINSSKKLDKAHEKKFKEFTGMDYSIEKDQTTAAKKAIDALASMAKTPSEYKSKYENLFMDLAEGMMYYKDLPKFVSERYKNHMYMPAARAFANETRFKNLAISNLVGEEIFTSVVILMYINGIRDFKTAGKEILKAVGLLQSSDLLLSLNAYGGTFEAHYPEYYIAWLYGYDNQKDIYGPSNYKKVTITNIFNLNVYNQAGELVAGISDGEVTAESLPIDVTGDCAEIYLEDGEDIGDYTIEFEARSDGEVNYSISGYSDNTVESYKINYSDIPVTSGTTLSGKLPYNQGGEAYNLTMTNGETETVVGYNDYLFGDGELQNLNVNVIVEGDGYADGVNLATKGDLVTLEAEPYFDAEFIGWYNENGELLSTDTKYNFIISQTMEIIAKFSQSTAKIKHIELPQVIDGILTITGDVSVRKDIEGKCYVAVYSKEGKLLHIKGKDVSSEEDGFFEINETFDVSSWEETPGYINVFLWDNLSPFALKSSVHIMTVQ